VLDPRTTRRRRPTFLYRYIIIAWARREALGLDASEKHYWCGASFRDLSVVVIVLFYRHKYMDKYTSVMYTRIRI